MGPGGARYLRFFGCVGFQEPMPDATAAAWRSQAVSPLRGKPGAEERNRPADRSQLRAALAGACSPEQASLFLDAGQRLVEAGAEAIVLAGTDLNLAFDGQSPGYDVIDALDVHVALLTDLVLNRISLADVAA
jgi:hypothetical protein